MSFRLMKQPPVRRSGEHPIVIGSHPLFFREMALDMPGGTKRNDQSTRFHLDHPGQRGRPGRAALPAHRCEAYERPAPLGPSRVVVTPSTTIAQSRLEIKLQLDLMSNYKCPAIDRPVVSSRSRPTDSGMLHTRR